MPELLKGVLPFLAAAAAAAATAADMTEGIWHAPGVVFSQLAAGVRTYKLTESRHRVLVVDSAGQQLAEAALQHILDCDAGSWFPMGSYARTRPQQGGGQQPTALTCMTPRPTAENLLALFNEDPVLADAMRRTFNVTQPCLHRENKIVKELGGKWWRTLLFPFHSYFRDVRAWVLAIHENMQPDVFHSDGHELHWREPGSDFVTVLVYPSAEQAAAATAGAGTGSAEPAADATRWEDGWGGDLLVAAHVARDGRTQQAEGEKLSREAGAALRIIPRHGRIVIFTGSLLHSSTPPLNARPPIETLPALQRAKVATPGGGVLAIPQHARWRLSSVMQLTCHNDAYHGPYETDDGPNVKLRMLGVLLVIAFGIYRGDLPNPFGGPARRAAHDAPAVAAELRPAHADAAAGASSAAKKGKKKQQKGRRAD